MKNDQTFTVHLGDFDGPLSLLYELIRKSEMNIYDIPIAKITDQYLAHLKHFEGMEIDLAGDYFVLAAELMAIKSQMLLPQPSLIDDEDDELYDPREDLVKRLLIYQQYQSSAQQLKQKLNHRQKMHSRPAILPTNLPINEQDHFQMSINLLKTAFQKVMANQQQTNQPTFNVAEWQYSINGQSQLVERTLQNNHQIDLINFLSDHAQIEELITTFLAILEMAKQHLLLITKEHDQILLKAVDGDEDE